MAFDYNGSTHYQRNTAFSASSYYGAGVTFSVWLQFDGSGGTYRITSVDDSSDNMAATMFINSSNLLAIAATLSGGSGFVLCTNTTAMNGASTTWRHCLGTWDGSNNTTACRVWLNGTEETTAQGGSGNDPSISPARHTIGRRSTATQYFDGRIAEVGVWRGVLPQAVITMLSKGYSPAFFMDAASGLEAYVPLVRSANDRISQSSITETAPDPYAHPRIIYPTSHLVGYTATAAASSGVVHRLAGYGGLAGMGGIAGRHGGMAG